MSRPVRVASDQPSFLPWAGFWNKALSVDLMIYSVGVQFNYGYVDNRVKLAGSWLTLPITKETKHATFKDVRFDPTALPKVGKSLRNVFGKRFPYAENRIWPVIDNLEQYDGPNLLTELNQSLIREMSYRLGYWDYHTIVDGVAPDPSQSKTERLIARIRRHVEGPVDYYLGRGALDYIEPQLMTDAGIRLFVQAAGHRFKDETVLHLMAEDPFVIETIMTSGEWEEVRL